MEWIVGIVAAIAVGIGVVNALVNSKRTGSASSAVEEAEQALSLLDEASAGDASMGGLTARSGPPGAEPEPPNTAAESQRLFMFYIKQINRYQEETRARASWSFYFAIIAMFAGFGFVLWGGWLILDSESGENMQMAGGGLLSTVGGAVSGFITKTFLDVHKLSLQQLNHYFEQPVLNNHILMAKRLAEASADPDTRRMAYEQIIMSIAKLIDSKADDTPSNGVREPQG